MGIWVGVRKPSKCTFHCHQRQSANLEHHGVEIKWTGWSTAISLILGHRAIKVPLDVSTGQRRTKATLWVTGDTGFEKKMETTGRSDMGQ